MPDSMRYRIMHTSSSKCQDLEELLQSMETQSALSEQRSTPRPSQQRYRAAFSSSTIVRLPSPWTSLRGSRLHYNRTARLVKSSISNSASVPVPTKWRHSYRAYITTHSKYHGHRRRHNYIVIHNTARPPLDTHTFTFSFLSFSGFFSTGFF